MSVRRAGIINDVSADAASAFPRVELNPTTTIQVTEFGISIDAAPDSTVAPVDWRVYRNTLVGTGVAAVVDDNLVKMQTDIATALVTTGLVELTAIGGGTVSNLHRLEVPNVSGVIWVAAPGREFDCIAAEFVGIQNEAALGTGLHASTYMVFEE